MLNLESKSVSHQIIAYRKNLVDYGSRWGAQRDAEEKFIKLKAAFIQMREKQHEADI
jgi:hypothetical protein